MKVRRRPVSPSDFFYPNRWERLGLSGLRGALRDTLVLSPVFDITHAATGLKFPSVLARRQFDREHIYIVLSKMDLDDAGRRDLRDRLNPVWYACADGFAEVAFAEVEMRVEYTRRWFRGDEMAERRSDPWNVWLAVAMTLRHRGFTLPAACCPYLTRRRWPA